MTSVLSAGLRPVFTPPAMPVGTPPAGLAADRAGGAGAPAGQAGLTPFGDAGKRLAATVGDLMRTARSLPAEDADETVRKSTADGFRRDLSALLREVGFSEAGAEEKAAALTEGAFSGAAGVISLSLDRVASQSVTERYTAEGTVAGRGAYSRTEERAASVTLSQSFDLTLDLGSGDLSIERSETLVQTEALRVEEVAARGAGLLGPGPSVGALDLEGLAAKLKEGGAGDEAVRTLTALDTLLKGLRDGRTADGNRLSLDKPEQDPDGRSLRLRLTLSREAGMAAAHGEGLDAFFRLPDGTTGHTGVRGVSKEA